MPPFVPPEPPEPPTIIVPAVPPEVGFGSPWSPADGENRDRILDWWRAWWRRVFFPWLEKFIVWADEWLESAAEYIGIHSVPGYSWRTTPTPIADSGTTDVEITDVTELRPLMVGDLVSDQTTLTNYGVITVVLDETHATVEYLGYLHGLPGPNSVPADVAVGAYIDTPGTFTRIAGDAQWGDPAVAGYVDDIASLTRIAGDLVWGDPAVASYIADPASDTRPAGDLLWLEGYNVTRFGAMGDGVTDDTAAFSAAIDYANSLNPPVGDRDVIGVTITIPDGRYVISGSLSTITRSGVCFKGTSQEGTVLLLSGNETIFTWGTDTEFPIGGGISNVKFEYLDDPEDDDVVIYLHWASRLIFSNIALVNVGILTILGSSAIHGATQIDFVEVRGFTFNGGNAVFNGEHGAGLNLTNVRIFVTGVPAPVINRTSTMDTLVGTNALQFTEGTWDTLHVNGCMFERYYYGIYVNMPSATVANNFHVANTYFDYHRESCVYMVAQTGGIVTGMWFSNMWFAAWEGTAVGLVGPGVIRNIHFGDCHVVSSGSHGFLLATGTSIRDIAILDTLIDGVNRLDVNGSGILALTGSHIQVEGCVSGYDGAWGGFAWQAYNGLYFVADLAYFVVTGNDMAGTAGGFTFEANTAGSRNRRVKDNLGANYAGLSAMAAPASAAVVTNTSGMTWEIYIAGGTVGGISKNGTATGMITGSLIIEPGETFAITYSVAPTVTRFVQA